MPTNTTTIFKSLLPDVAIPTNLSLPEFVREYRNKPTYEGNKKAIIDSVSGKSYTYDELYDAINKVASGLQNKGLIEGNVVGVCLPNVLEYPVILFGAMTIGAAPTTINPNGYSVEDLVALLEDASIVMLFTTADVVNKHKEEMKKLKTLKEIVLLGDDKVEDGVDFTTSSFSDLIHNDGKFKLAKFDPKEHIALLPHSSGTTGLPKGIMLTHYNIIANICQMNASEAAGWTTEETFIAFVPFFGIYGMVILLAWPLQHGFTIITMPSFELKPYLNAIQTYKATTAHLVPPVARMFCEDPILDEYDLSSLKTVFCGAAPLGAKVEKTLKEKFNVSVQQAYGMTELSPLTHIAPLSCPWEGSSGRLLPNNCLKIVDLNTNKELGIDEEGEICLKGPSVMKGYLNNPDETAKTIDEDGFLHTGDVGRVNKDGFLFVVDRIKDLIKYNGDLVPSAPLETLLHNHPSVVDVAVVGKPDKKVGELPVAFVVVQKDQKVTADDIMQFIAKKVEDPDKRLQEVIFVEEIPTTLSGKIIKRKLRQVFENHPAK